jgi:hypothetical protein
MLSKIDELWAERDRLKIAAERTLLPLIILFPLYCSK